MSHKAPIIYSGFYDVPLAFVVWNDEKQFLFLRDFDEALDDYPNFYRVFTLPNLSDEEVKKSWVQIETLANQFVGEIPVAEIHFDSTKRKEIVLKPLENLIDKVARKT